VFIIIKLLEILTSDIYFNKKSLRYIMKQIAYCVIIFIALPAYTYDVLKYNWGYSMQKIISMEGKPIHVFDN